MSVYGGSKQQQQAWRETCNSLTGINNNGFEITVLLTGYMYGCNGYIHWLIQVIRARS